MMLKPDALISAAQCVSLTGLELEDIDSLINMASEAIAQHCGRKLIRSVATRDLDSFNDSILRLPVHPLIEVRSLRYDRARLFPEESELSGYTANLFTGTIYLPRVYERDQDVFRIVTDEGYTMVSYYGEDDPDDPVIGQLWLSPLGYVQWGLDELDEEGWLPFTGHPVPSDLEGACAEYVAYMMIKFKTGGAGMTKRERGYSFEGSSVAYEKGMPTHVVEMLEPYVVTAI
jgi:hypothetical protein